MGYRISRISLIMAYERWEVDVSVCSESKTRLLGGDRSSARVQWEMYEEVGYGGRLGGLPICGTSMRSEKANRNRSNLEKRQFTILSIRLLRR
jgi:hypothetical protein